MRTPQFIRFGSRRIGVEEHALVVAEIGINHEGDVQTCARMVEEAVKAGADAIKLQTIAPDRNYAPDTESHRLFSTATLTREETDRIFSLSRSHDIEAFTTVGDLATLEWVNQLKPTGYKVSSGLLTCTPLIQRLARTGRPLLMSTGMANHTDIDAAVNAASAADAEEIVLFHCTSIYPCPVEKLNLAAIPWLRERYGLEIGFSDHALGSNTAALAIAAGATAIEKHFSLDPSRAGYDHGTSLNPDEFRLMVVGIREAEAARGGPGKKTDSELLAIRDKNSRYLAVVTHVSAGELLDENNVGFIRLHDVSEALPASGFERVCGMRAVKDLPPFTALTESSIGDG